MKYTFLLLLFPILSCQPKKEVPHLQQLDWLIGTWKGVANNNPFYETWTKISDNELRNVNYTIVNGDTTGMNYGSIVDYGTSVFYNNGYQLQATSLKDGRVVFEDPKEGKRYEFFPDDKGHWIAKLKNGDIYLEYELTRIDATR